MQLTKILSIFIFIAFSFPKSFFAQKEVEAQLSNITSKPSGLISYAGMQNEYSITTNFKKNISKDSAQIISSILKIPGVIYCSFIPSNQFLFVKSGKIVSSDFKETLVVTIEKIKAALIPFALEINNYQEQVYKARK